MSGKEDNCCKQRFKAVENFLRRVAFNLGNTPSQTEVKIISCIPIDVTDLQQKIIQLEKQLEAVNRNVQSNTPRRTSVVHTAICNPLCSKISNAALPCKGASCGQSSTMSRSVEKNKSTISFIYPAGPSQLQDCRFSTDASDVTQNTKRNKSRRNFFNQKKKNLKNNKMKTHMIYYSQTKDRTPFNDYGLAEDGTSKNRDKEEFSMFNRSYLTDMIHKQYTAARVPDGEMNSSEFSTPICRDINPFVNVYTLESDIHSCCHGYFQNIDNHVNKQNRFDVFSPHRDSGHSYYDSNLYDIVPVKEKATTNKMNTEIPNRKDTKNLVGMAYYPENIRPRHKVLPVIVNYHTTAPKRKTLIKKIPTKHTHIKKELVLNKMAKMRPILPNVIKPQMNLEEKTRSVEFSEVYARRLGKTKTKSYKPNSSKCNNATSVIPNTDHQTSTVSNTNPPSPEDQTEETLNQIKSILQTVLTEVKTGKLGNISEQAKKDAVVQNGLSQSNIFGGSQLLHSFTYSPYNMNHYGAACSRQIPPSNVCYTHVPYGPVKCMQYPLLTQPTRNMCTSCYKNGQTNKLPGMKRAASAGTNTEQPQGRSKETENLIKEIYQSLALNVDIPVKGTTDKDHGDLRETIRNHETKTDEREAKHIAKAISEIFKNTNPIETSVTQNSNTPLASKMASDETSFRSQTMRNYRGITRKERINYKHCNSKSSKSNTINNEIERANSSCELEIDEESDNTIVNEEATESSSSETESDDITIAVKEPDKKKEKNGIFSKMLKMFKPRSKNKKVVKDDQTSDSDSDDYQTVYSKKIANPKSAPKPIRSKAHSKVFHSKQLQQRARNNSPGRAPYMEQEYRRRFNENLTFHHSQYPKPTSVSRYTTHRPVYYQNVEARNTSVNPASHPRTITRENNPRTESTGGQTCSRNQNHVNCKRGNNVVKFTMAPKSKAWLRKHNPGIHCGQQWKKFVLEG